MSDPIQNQATPESPAPSANGDSKIFGVSVRGIIALTIIATFCTLAGMVVFRGGTTSQEVMKDLLMLALTVLGFYMGKQNATQPK